MEIFFEEFGPFSGVQVDSRQVIEGDLFFALPGEKVDGHQFLSEAAKKGATHAVVSSEYQGESFGLTLIPVENTLAALQTMARKTLVCLKKAPLIIGVTGSAGKTTTKDFITTLLREKFRVTSNPGNYNSQIGMPLAILNSLTGDEEILVLEYSMTHAGNITDLLKIAVPDIALITSVSYAHSCNFTSLDDIALAKGEIFSHPNTRVGILPEECPNREALLALGMCKKKTFSHEMVLPTPPFPGAHNLHNLHAACTVCLECGMEWEEIRSGIPKLKLPKKRLEKVVRSGICFINDSYNASPSGVKAALQSLPAPTQGGKKIAILGEMKELGTFSDMCHQEVGEEALSHVDQFFCVGEGCRPIFETWKKNKRPVKLFDTFEKMIPSLKETLKEGDVVLLKGANSGKIWRVLDEY